MRIIGFILITLLMAGCASILTPGTERINVTSTKNKPFEATVDGQYVKVPGQVMVSKDGDDKIIQTSEPGCAQTTYVEKKVEPLFWLNILAGGLFGSSTDLGTGKMWAYDDSVTITCVQSE